MTPGQAKKTVVLGVLGVDAHVVGNKIMAHALESAGFKVVNIGTFSSQEDFIRAAIESAADALLVASLCGHGEIECRGFREKCVESGIGDIHHLLHADRIHGEFILHPVRRDGETTAVHKTRNRQQNLLCHL